MDLMLGEWGDTEAVRNFGPKYPTNNLEGMERTNISNKELFTSISNHVLKIGKVRAKV